MKYDCVDDILIFLTELNNNNIAKVGKDRVKIETVWKEEINKKIFILAPHLFDLHFEAN